MPARKTQSRYSEWRTANAKKIERFTLGLGLAIVGLSVIGGFVLSFYPKAFGLTESNPAIGFGLAALAAFRLFALRKEMRRQAEEDSLPLEETIKKSGRRLAGAKRA